MVSIDKLSKARSWTAAAAAPAPVAVALWHHLGVLCAAGKDAGCLQGSACRVNPRLRGLIRHFRLIQYCDGPQAQSFNARRFSSFELEPKTFLLGVMPCSVVNPRADVPRSIIARVARFWASEAGPTVVHSPAGPHPKKNSKAAKCQPADPWPHEPVVHTCFRVPLASPSNIVDSAPFCQSW